MGRKVEDCSAMQWHRAKPTGFRGANSTGPERLAGRAVSATSIRLADAPASPSSDFLALPNRAGQQNLSSFMSLRPS